VTSALINAPRVERDLGTPARGGLLATVALSHAARRRLRSTDAGERDPRPPFVGERSDCADRTHSASAEGSAGTSSTNLGANNRSLLQVVEISGAQILDRPGEQGTESAICIRGCVPATCRSATITLVPADHSGVQVAVCGQKPMAGSGQIPVAADTRRSGSGVVQLGDRIWALPVPMLWAD
jgi:hypothetical protein